MILTEDEGGTSGDEYYRYVSPDDIQGVVDVVAMVSGTFSLKLSPADNVLAYDE